MNADIELILDLREYLPSVTDKDGFAALWQRLEQVLGSRDLSERPVYLLDAGADGRIAIEVARIARPGPAETFSVVAVRERATPRYRCQDCGGYGPFICASCEGQDNRVCDAHVIILDGALRATCVRHRPGCADCGRLSSFRCAGPSCRRDRAWCDRHRRPHPRDRDISYCPGCFDILFPVCEEPGCRGVGTVACEQVNAQGRRCGHRCCTRHAGRWQVYGAEKLGIGLCRTHRMARGMPLEEALFQIVAASALRRPAMRPPSLAGFAHNLRHLGHSQIAVDYPQLLVRLRAALDRAERAGAVLRDRARVEKAWEQQVTKDDEGRGEGERILTRLRALVRAQDRKYGETIAGSLKFVQYKPPLDRPGQTRRNAMLFVDLPQELRGIFAGKERVRLNDYSARLGVDVRLEGGNRR
ncbi:hypothetical protein ACFQ08_13875 [Streptosporangium algeriense]|uniref:Uncharacterized protein n=1 Tax=Streptosporangium algeriense TaxID=1682748 RepID=A0ABW3DSH6_9ACTN